MTTLPDERLGLEPVTAVVDGLPEGEIVDGGCGWTEEAWLVTYAQQVFSGRPLRLGERGMTAGAIGRVVEVEVVDVHVDATRQLETGTIVRVLVADTELSQGYRLEVPGPDVDEVMTQDLVTVFGNDDLGFVRPWRVLSMVDGGLSFNGYCEHEGEVIAAIADQLGDLSSLAMLVRFAEANARGEGVAELSDAFERWRADLNAKSEPPSWQDQDPAARTLEPRTVPAELRDSLDVFGVSFAVDDLGDAAAIGVRTESGISSSLVGAPVLPIVWPLYFVRDVDATVEVFVQSLDPDDNAATIIGTVSLAEIEAAGGGIEVTGSVADGTVEIATLSRADLAERLGIGLDELDALRASRLSD